MDKPTEALTGVPEPYRTILDGQSINRLADEAAIPYSTLRRKLREPMSLTMGDLLRLADALETTPASLLPERFRAAEVA